MTATELAVSLLLFLIAAYGANWAAKKYVFKS